MKNNFGKKQKNLIFHQMKKSNNLPNLNRNKKITSNFCYRSTKF